MKIDGSIQDMTEDTKSSFHGLKNERTAFAGGNPVDDEDKGFWMTLRMGCGTVGCGNFKI